MTLLAFDIETIPDVDSGRRLYGLAGLSDKEVGQIMFHKRRQETGGTEFLRLHQHRVFTLSAVLADADGAQLLRFDDADEALLLRGFFSLIDERRPKLVTWNGARFDLPVLEYRAMLHGIPCAAFWNGGRGYADHCDLKTAVGGRDARQQASLEEMARLLSLPGKLGMHGGRVWDEYLAGSLEAIRDYCDYDALNTYLILLRYRLVNAELAPADYETACAQLRDRLQSAGSEHLQVFLRAWQDGEA